MAENTDIFDGTVSVTTGTKDVTGVGTLWLSAGIQAGDMFGSDGHPRSRIDTVNSNTSITLKDNWRGPTLAAGSPYWIRYQADSSRYSALLGQVRKMVSQATLSAFSALSGAANKLPYFIDENTMGLVDFKAWSRSLLGLTPATDKGIYFPDEDTAATFDLTPFGRTLVGHADLPTLKGAVNLLEALTGNRTYYVRKDGNDANNGLADTNAGAFLTINRALDVAYNQVDSRIYKITIQIRNGTYVENIAIFGGAKRNGARSGNKYDIYLTGDINAPGNVKIAGPGSCLTVSGGARVDIRGFELAPANPASWCILAEGSGTQVNFGKLRFGATSNADHMLSQNNALITFDTGYEIVGGALNHYHADGGNIKNIGGAVTVTLIGNPAFAGQFAGVSHNQIFLYQVTFSGSATGRRFLTHYGGSIRCEQNNYDFLPGSLPGVEEAGGRFDYNARFSVHKGNNTQTLINNNNEQLITWTAFGFSTGGAWDGVNGRYVPRSGLCSMSAAVCFTTNLVAGSLIQLSIYKNGSQYKSVIGHSTGTGPDSLCISIAAEQANGTDYYQVFARADGSTGVVVSGQPSLTWFVGAQD